MPAAVRDQTRHIFGELACGVRHALAERLAESIARTGMLSLRLRELTVVRRALRNRADMRDRSSSSTGSGKRADISVDLGVGNAGLIVRAVAELEECSFSIREECFGQILYCQQQQVPRRACGCGMGGAEIYDARV